MGDRVTKRRRGRVHQRSSGRRMFTTAQERYLLVLTEAAQTGKLLLQKELADVARVTEQSVCRWKRDDAFIEAVNTAIQRSLRTRWLGAELAAATRATRGSLPDWRLYLESGGPTSWNPNGTPTPASDGGIGGVQSGTIVHIHAIPERQPMSALPPLLTIPAQTPTPSTNHQK